MKMLRDWNGESNQLIIDILKQFGVDVDKIHLFKYETLSPDSFIWIFAAGSERYCLYAEDYSSLDQVKQAMKDHVMTYNPHDEFELLEVKNRVEWKESSPVQSADYYEPPARPEEFMKYAATSGFDFVFLGKSITKPSSNLS